MRDYCINFTGDTKPYYEGDKGDPWWVTLERIEKFLKERDEKEGGHFL